MLERILEPELMDTPAEAQEYNSMDNAAVNTRFIDDLLTAADWHTDPPSEPLDVLDIGTGTALIPIELCQRVPNLRVVAVDGATSMLHVAKVNIALAHLEQRILLDRLDAKQLDLPKNRFAAVVANSIVHHIPEPLPVLAEAVRVTQPGGLIFMRDLFRPAEQDQLEALVATHAGEGTGRQQQLLAESLRAALTLEETQALVGQLGFPPETVTATSDRHWTFAARKPAE